jgi:hypothetical protein
LLNFKKLLNLNKLEILTKIKHFNEIWKILGGFGWNLNKLIGSFNYVSLELDICGKICYMLNLAWNFNLVILSYFV